MGALTSQAELAVFDPVGQGGAGRLLTRGSFNGIYLAAECKLGWSGENWNRDTCFEDFSSNFGDTWWGKNDCFLSAKNLNQANKETKK